MKKSMFIYLMQYSELQGLEELGTEQVSPILRASIAMTLYYQKNECTGQQSCCSVVDKKPTIAYANGTSFISKALHTKMVKLFRAWALPQPIPFMMQDSFRSIMFIEDYTAKKMLSLHLFNIGRMQTGFVCSIC